MKRMLWMVLGALIALFVVRYVHVDIENGRDEWHQPSRVEPAGSKPSPIPANASINPPEQELPYPPTSDEPDQQN